MIDDLDVWFADLHLKNPCVIASGPLTSTLEKIAIAEKAGVGGVVTKMAIPEAMNKRMRAWIYPSGLFSPSDERLPVEKAVKLVSTVRKSTDLVVISNILAFDLESWVKLAVELENAGAHAIEVNMSCPNLPQEDSGKKFLGQDRRMVRRLTEEIVSEVSIPVICKLTPLAEDIASIAEACKRGGADGVTAINAPLGAPPVDIFNGGKPLLPGVNAHSFGGITGGWIKPLAMMCIAEIASKVDIQIAGCGGIQDWRDVVEAIMWGAVCFQINTAVIMRGFDVVKPILDGLRGYMDKMGYSHLDDFRGMALKYLKPSSEIDFSNLIFRVDESLCNGCGRCGVFGHCTAITIDEKAVIDPEKCVNCGMCMQVCKRNAIMCYWTE